jgi:hypothetical protein
VVDGQPGRALAVALDLEPAVVEANRLLQGLAIPSRVARERANNDAGVSVYRIEGTASDPAA